MLAFPKADIPTTQLSLRANLDPKEHMAIGRALQPLRNEGVYIIASGKSQNRQQGMINEYPACLPKGPDKNIAFGGPTVRFFTGCVCFVQLLHKQKKDLGPCTDALSRWHACGL